MEPRARFAQLLAPQGSVLDVGCWDYGFKRFCDDRGFASFNHAGVDREQPQTAPPQGYRFVQMDVEVAPLPFNAESFDGVFASHVLEHLQRPMVFLDEVFRVLKPGGYLYLETPSNRSVWMPSMPIKHEQLRSLSFWDDPTHIGRPHTPQSLHRLFRMYGAQAVSTGYCTSRKVRLRFPWLVARALLTRNAALLEEAMWKAVGFAVFGICLKSASGERHYMLPR